MRRVFVLLPDASFGALAELMASAGAELTQLASCTFPSRPEARRATWSVNGEPVARYRYEPDIELRWFARDRPELLDSTPESWELFDTWENLESELTHGAWREVFRAAAAFRVAAEQREPGVQGEAILAAAIAGAEHSAQAAASQLAQVATPASRGAIERVLSGDTNIETRVDLRRALDRIEMSEFGSR